MSKLFNAYNARTIPIYWGPTDLGEYINLDAVIWLASCFVCVCGIQRCLADKKNNRTQVQAG